MEKNKYDMKIISRNTYIKAQMINLSYSKINRFRAIIVNIGKDEFYSLIARTDNGIETVIGTYPNYQDVIKLEDDIINAYQKNQKIFIVPESIEYIKALKEYKRISKEIEKLNKSHY